MVSLDSSHDSKPSSPTEEITSPRISFSSEFLDESSFITICPNPQGEAVERAVTAVHSNADFEFLSGNMQTEMMTTADELFSEGKMLPFWQTHNAAKLNAIHLKTNSGIEETTRREDNVRISGGENRVRWLLDDDPSPRPPNCIVLWKELLKLKKQRRPSTLSPSSSSSSSSSKSSMHELSVKEERKERAKGEDKRSNEKRARKVQEKRSATSIRIRPVINVPICTTPPVKNSALPPLFSLRKGRIER